MWFQLNLLLRDRAPKFHQFLKSSTLQWRLSGQKSIPIPVFWAGKLFFLHPFFLTHNQCEPEVQSYLKSSLKQGDVFIDVGANFGFHTILASRLVGNTGHIAAFEPSPENLKILRYHCRVNSLKNVKVYPDAVGDNPNSSVEFVLVDGGKHSSNSLTISGDVPHLSESQKTVINVPMTTLDDFCQSHQIFPNLIKIDVEGAELLVLQGARKIIEQNRPNIIIGIHPFWMPEGQIPENVIDFFNSYNYKIIKFGQTSFVQDIEYGDYIALPQ